MIFLTFAAADGSHLGLLTDDNVLDLTKAWPDGQASAPRHVGDLAEAGEAGLAIVRDLASTATAANLVALASLTLMAPIPRP